MSTLVKYNNLYFTTCTIHQWTPILESNEAKQIILDSFEYLATNKKLIIYSFVILNNHFHFLYEVLPSFTNSEIKHAILSYSSKQLLENMSLIEKSTLAVNKRGRKYQVWKSPSLSVEIISESFFKQKFHYIHKDVERAGLNPQSYLYSSYPSYVKGEPLFRFLTLWG